MFSNPGNPLHGIPPHWHYVSSGLSDLHGDGRVHEYVPCNASSDSVPQSLASFVLVVGNTVHIKWLIPSLQQQYISWSKLLKLF